MLRFDFSPVPAAATVVSATLRLEQIYRDDISSSTIDVHRITSPWRYYMLRTGFGSLVQYEDPQPDLVQR
ncbi:hypothetical protein [Sorangium sp. So ce1036]|uniref:hypothetical protein n=1 Tax=Sorangium sp. So ce1036 TaxID=3133328 RepID=UPI003F5262A6